MTRRTRNFLLDNTTGTVYSGVSNTIGVGKEKIAAGIVPKTLKTTLSSPGKAAKTLLANKPVKFNREVKITQILLNVTVRTGLVINAAAPSGSSITVRFRKTDSQNAETILGTYSILSGQTSSNNIVSITLQAEDSLFIDVTEIGSIKPGLGLTVYTSYFG